MLKLIEFGLLGGSLVVIVGLIVSGARDHSENASAPPASSPEDHPNAHQHGNTL